MVDFGLIAPVARFFPRRPTLSASVAGFVMVLGVALSGQAKAQDVRIVAIVNDEVISGADLQARLKFVEATSGLPDNADVEKRIEPQILKQLIDEKLEMQEAKKEDVSIDHEDVEQEEAGLEQENNLPPGGLEKFLAQKGLSKQTLDDQIYANIAWAQTVRRRWMPFTTVGDEEVADRIKEIEANRKLPQDHIAEIFLPVNEPSEEPQVQDTAQHLMEQIKQNGHFQQVARQFSQAPSAAVGGDLGWVQAGSLSPDIEAFVSKMHPGQMGGPVRLTGGYYIFAMVDRRAGGGQEDMQVSLDQIVFPLAENAGASAHDATVAKARSAVADARTCGEFAKLGKQLSPQLSGPLGTVKIGDLPPELRETVRQAKVAVPTDPIAVHGGIGVYMVCARQGSDIEPEVVRGALMRQRLNNRSTQYLADLRRQAFIDMRAAS